MDVAAAVAGIQPLGGQVVPIRTVQETRPPEEFADAYVAEVSVKSASKVIKALDAAFPRDPSLPLGHLRRFAKREALPAPLRSTIEDAESFVAAEPPQTIFVLITPPLSDIDKLRALLAPFAPPPPPHPPTSESVPDSPSPSSPIRLHTTKVPLHPPFNTHQSDTWTRTLWPVVFNPAAPRSIVAPPPQNLNRAQESIQIRAGYYLALSQKVAEEAKQSGKGRGVGAVIVDPAIEAELDSREENGQSSTDWSGAVVAVAGDARYSRSEGRLPSQAEKHAGVTPNPASRTYSADLEGGPELHALMRGVELVSRGRRDDEHERYIRTAIATPPDQTERLSPLESYFLYQVDSPASTRSPPHNIHPESPSSPKKRKQESPNPESSLAETLDLTHGPPPTTLVPPAPAPASAPALPPLSTALPNPAASATSFSSAAAATTSPSDPHQIPSTNTPRTRICTREQGGYLCTDLDVYLSHEPCLCCSMGMLLSRFRAVIFPRSGRLRSGGLASEPVFGPTPVHSESQSAATTTEAAAEGIAVTGAQENEEEEKEGGQGVGRMYYGLHWRKELNWRALGFEFVEDEDVEKRNPASDDEEEVVFHA